LVSCLWIADWEEGGWLELEGCWISISRKEFISAVCELLRSAIAVD